MENDFDEFPEQPFSPIVLGKSKTNPSFPQCLTEKIARNTSGSRSRTATPYSSQIQANPLIKKLTNMEGLNFSSMSKPEDSFSYRLNMSNNSPYYNKSENNDLKNSKLSCGIVENENAIKTSLANSPTKSRYIIPYSFQKSDPVLVEFCSIVLLMTTLFQRI